jgi:hypothetical protein
MGEVNRLVGLSRPRDADRLGCRMVSACLLDPFRTVRSICYIRKPTSRSRGGLGVFCVCTEPCDATSYGDDHHHCWAVTVFLRLIEDGVVLGEPTQANLYVTKLLCSQS